MDINVGRRQAINGLILIATLLAGMIAVGLSNALSANDPPARKADDFSPYVAKDGGISLPADYREKFQHLGTWAVATTPDKPVKELHNVYTRPEDIEAYHKEGKFPDGAVLVKEITNVGSDKMTTGQSTWSKDIKIWFVMVKDSKRNVATDYRTDCRTCHVPAKKDNWVYIRGYPLLVKPIPHK